MVIIINLVNTNNYNQFIYISQLDIEELKTYILVIQKIYITYWGKIIEEKLDQLYKNKTWKLILTSKIKLNY